MRFGEALLEIVPGVVLMDEDSADFEGTRSGIALVNAPDPVLGVFGRLEVVVETNGGWAVLPGAVIDVTDLDGNTWRLVRPRPVPTVSHVSGRVPDMIAPRGPLEDYVSDSTTA